MSGLLVIMGSGETAPTMVKPHRAIFERVGDRPAMILDTPYGFQSNADDISARAVGYFATSVGRDVEVVSWRRQPDDVVARERALAAMRGAGWLFAGPGSPTYTLRQWADTPIPELLVEQLRGDGVVVFASAAALTLGSHTVPVYEIYKAGIDPHWVPGLDLVAACTGLPAVVIPHYDNAEGGHHDTRYCYLGEGRLAAMEADLPQNAFVLGVDEHTAVLLDLTERTASVVGNGVLSVRRHGSTIAHPAGAVLTFDALAKGGTDHLAKGGTDQHRGGRPAAGHAGESPGPAGDSSGQSGAGDPATAPPSVRALADLLEERFSAALAGRDVDGCVGAVLELEQGLVDWSADTLTSDDGDHARSLLRAMVVRLGQLAEAGARDPRRVLGPFVVALLDLRAQAREERDWATSDRIRDQLAAAGIEVRDTPDGVVWELR